MTILVQEPAPLDARAERRATSLRVAAWCGVGCMALAIAAAAVESCRPAQAAPPRPGYDLVDRTDALVRRVQAHTDRLERLQRAVVVLRDAEEQLYRGSDLQRAAAWERWLDARAQLRVLTMGSSAEREQGGRFEAVGGPSARTDKDPRNVAAGVRGRSRTGGERASPAGQHRRN